MSDFTQHGMVPQVTHDERARQSFVKTFRAHLSGKVMPGNYQVFQKRVVPRFQAQHGRPPEDERELRAVMTQDPYYQFWSAMQRRSQEMLWESVIDPTERQLPELIQRAKQLADRKRGKGQAGSLHLDPDVAVPRYHAAADIHLQPGGYHTDFVADDVAAGVVYDKGINLYMGGALGPENNAMGDLLVTYFREKYPARQPKRILDMGCAIGNSTVVWARAFPQAEVHGIDVGAPVLRYAHARAESMNVPVHFRQANAEDTKLPAGSFDLIISHIMLHETSKSAIVNVMRESLRLLAPNGLMLHLEIPRGDDLMEQFMHNWESYNNNETFARYMTGLDLKAVAVKGGFVPAKTRVDHYSPGYDVAKTNYSESFIWKILVGEK
ncbi:MAG: class I SAM-dependent methyltransferase [Steroidobacteraceae bacterium]|nr:class I SAM-dependent methyltransferase [Steroidobacteraceae bacterium]